MKKLVLFSVFAAMVLSSCWYNRKWDDLHPVPPVPLVCNDTLGITMSYSLHIAPLIQTNCGTSSVGCHKVSSPNGDLTTYGGVKLYSQTGQLLGAIKHQSPYNPMPQGAPKLSDCQIAVVAKWIQQGYAQ